MRGLNPQHPPWQGGTLPIELIPQKLDSICYSHKIVPFGDNCCVSLNGRGAPTRTESPGFGDRWFDRLTDTSILNWGEWWRLNPRHQEPQSCTLPTELHPPYGGVGRIRTFGRVLTRRQLSRLLV